MQRASYVAALVIAATCQLACADLPVHCLRHQVVGDWEFTLGPLGPKRSKCGHKSPDSPYKQPSMKVLEKLGPLTKRKFSLQDPNTVATEDGSSGTWTMIYDEAFEVSMDGLVYMAFSKFGFTDSGMQNNISYCDQTQIGWYHDKTRSQWGCYVGKKVGAVDALDIGTPAPKAAKVKTTVLLDETLSAFGSSLQTANTLEEDKKVQTSILSSWLNSDSDQNPEPHAPATSDAAAPVVSLAAIEEHAAEQQDAVSLDEFAAPAEFKPWTPPSSNGFDKPMAEKFQQSVATSLNFLQLGWTAHAYDQFQGKTPRELNMYAGVRHLRVTPSQKRAANMDASMDDQSKSLSFLGLESAVKHASLQEENFDWRNKDGKNWLTPVVTQGDCGSCYTISTVHMLTARNRIKAGNTAEPSFSVTFPLYCSEYNQGCDGGYGFLQTKWSEDVGLVPEHCLPFSTGGGSCKIRKNCDMSGDHYRATNHHYVGGYYGASDADSIKTNLIEHGPAVMSFEPSEDFMYYKDGVYKSGPHKIHQEWEQVDHAVLLTGYGVDKSKTSSSPYWTMQNSWGTDWGEEGYFRMAKGIDESGCESIVVSADVVKESSNPTLVNFVAGFTSF